MELESTGHNLAIRFSFLPYGAFLSPEPHKLALDIGNQLCPGIIDHHQPGAEGECTASIVLRYPHYVSEHLKKIPLEDIVFITHISPDLDAMTSVFLSYSLLARGSFPPFADKIARYVNDIDQGICFRYPGITVTVYSLYTALCALIQKKGKKQGRSDETIYQSQIIQGFSLWNFVLSNMKADSDLHQSDLFKKPHPFEKAQELVEKDFALYLHDLDISKKGSFLLPLKNDQGFETVDGLLVENPRSLLFRSWARGDNVNSPQGRGFVFLAINNQNNRYIISVDPQASVYLKGLGDKLEEAETRKRQALGKERKGSPRPGYENPDPWYDGRNPLHNFSIIDTPRGGTVLTWEEISDLIREYSAGVYLKSSLSH